MTREEAKARQEEIEKHYKLGFWYGVNCEKCCGVFPKIVTGIGTKDQCRYECEVCGTTTEPKDMPWQAAEAWNNNEYTMQQLRLF